MLELETTLEPFGPACAIFLTDDQVASLSGARTPPVVVTIDGRSQRLRVARMGGPNCIGLSRAARSALGVQIGDRVRARVELDTAERTVEVPPELAGALDTAGLRGAFDALSYTRRKELAAGVSGAKRAETRQRRIARALDELRADLGEDPAAGHWWA